MKKSGSKKTLKGPVRQQDPNDYFSLRYTPSVSADGKANPMLHTKSLKSLTRGPTPERTSVLDPKELDFKSMSSDRQRRRKIEQRMSSHHGQYSVLDSEDLKLIRDVNKPHYSRGDVLRTASFS
jgi:hypothetical protein